MKITRTDNAQSYTLRIEKDGKHYTAQIWMNDSSSKFQDWEVTDSHGNKVEFDIEDEIISEIDENWDNFIDN